MDVVSRHCAMDVDWKRPVKMYRGSEGGVEMHIHPMHGISFICVVSMVHLHGKRSVVR